MRSHFTLSDRTIEFESPSAKAARMGSHFRTGSRFAMACAISGATAMMASVCSAQIAADYATNYFPGPWAAGQNGGHGFGAWSFDGTATPGGVADPGGQQTLSSASAIGPAWTLFNLGTAPPSGISDVGRSINGGLAIGQTFETVIQNPVGYHFYGGYDILFTGGPDNNPAGNNSAALRVSEFNYYTSFPYWNINDANPGTTTSLSSAATAIAGMKLDLTITSATTYFLKLTPLNGAPFYSQDGVFSGPIDYVNFRLYDGTSSGPNDAADNFGISYMTVVPEPSSLALLGLGAAGLAFLRRRK